MNVKKQLLLLVGLMALQPLSWCDAVDGVEATDATEQPVTLAAPVVQTSRMQRIAAFSKKHAFTALKITALLAAASFVGYKLKTYQPDMSPADFTPGTGRDWSVLDNMRAEAAAFWEIRYIRRLGIKTFIGTCLPTIAGFITSQTMSQYTERLKNALVHPLKKCQNLETRLQKSGDNLRVYSFDIDKAHVNKQDHPYADFTTEYIQSSCAESTSIALSCIKLIHNNKATLELTLEKQHIADMIIKLQTSAVQFKEAYENALENKAREDGSHYLITPALQNLEQACQEAFDMLRKGLGENQSTQEAMDATQISA